MSINNNLVPGFNDEQDESLKINLEKIDSVDNCLILYLNGYIDTYNSSFFQKRVSAVVDAGYTRLPLYEMAPENVERLRKSMQNYGLIK